MDISDSEFSLSVYPSQVEVYPLHGFLGFRKDYDENRVYKPRSSEEQELLWELGNNLGAFYKAKTLLELMEATPFESSILFVDEELQILIPLTDEVQLLYSFGYKLHLPSQFLY